MRWILLLLLCLPAQAVGLSLNHLSLDVGKFYNQRDPYWPEYTLTRERGKGERWNHHLSMNIDSTLFKTRKFALDWDQNIIGNSTTHQYREVTWKWRLRAEYKNLPVAIFWDHQSRHFLEGEPDFKYPLRDIYGVSLCFYNCK